MTEGSVEWYRAIDAYEGLSLAEEASAHYAVALHGMEPVPLVKKFKDYLQ